jgi:DNA-directed RNA polymerase beta' subunit
MGDTIIGVQFGIANPADIISRSVVEITTEKTFQTSHSQPVQGGVFDARFVLTSVYDVCWAL